MCFSLRPRLAGRRVSMHVEHIACRLPCLDARRRTESANRCRQRAHRSLGISTPQLPCTLLIGVCALLLDLSEGRFRFRTRSDAPEPVFQLADCIWRTFPEQEARTFSAGEKSRQRTRYVSGGVELHWNPISSPPNGHSTSSGRHHRTARTSAARRPASRTFSCSSHQRRRSSTRRCSVT